jgi:hypothetical protein
MLVTNLASHRPQRFTSRQRTRPRHYLIHPPFVPDGLFTTASRTSVVSVTIDSANMTATYRLTSSKLRSRPDAMQGRVYWYAIVSFHGRAGKADERWLVFRDIRSMEGQRHYLPSIAAAHTGAATPATTLTPAACSVAPACTHARAPTYLPSIAVAHTTPIQYRYGVDKTLIGSRSRGARISRRQMDRGKYAVRRWWR